LLETSTTRSPGRYTLLHIRPFPADPQVSSIAPVLIGIPDGRSR
jgi:hypothetical protein